MVKMWSCYSLLLISLTLALANARSFAGPNHGLKKAGPTWSNPGYGPGPNWNDPGNVGIKRKWTIPGLIGHGIKWIHHHFIKPHWNRFNPGSGEARPNWNPNQGGLIPNGDKFLPTWPNPNANPNQGGPIPNWDEFPPNWSNPDLNPPGGSDTSSDQPEPNQNDPSQGLDLSETDEDQPGNEPDQVGVDSNETEQTPDESEPNENDIGEDEPDLNWTDPDSDGPRYRLSDSSGKIRKPRWTRPVWTFPQPNGFRPRPGTGGWRPRPNTGGSRPWSNNISPGRADLVGNPKRNPASGSN